MSEQTVLAAFQTLLSTPALAALVKEAHTELPPLPYMGAYPWVLIQPETQTSERIAIGLAQQQGFYSLLYLDELTSARGGLPLGQIMANARTFAATLRTAIRRDPTLGGAVDAAGEDAGIITHYSEAGSVSEFADVPLYYIPIMVHVREHGEPIY